VDTAAVTQGVWVGLKADSATATSFSSHYGNRISNPYWFNRI